MKQIKKQFARAMRKEPTEAEARVWVLLRDRKYRDLKWRRQHVIEGFVVDFYNVENKIAIEVDGSVHDREDVKDYDAMRQAIIEEQGIRVIRVKNSEIAKSLGNLYRDIKAEMRPSSAAQDVRVSPKPGGRKATTTADAAVPLLPQEDLQEKVNPHPPRLEPWSPFSLAGSEGEGKSQQLSIGTVFDQDILVEKVIAIDTMTAFPLSPERSEDGRGGTEHQHGAWWVREASQPSPSKRIQHLTQPIALSLSPRIAGEGGPRRSIAKTWWVRGIPALALALTLTGCGPLWTPSWVNRPADLTKPGVYRTGSLNVARMYHTATLLNDGRVLVVGGVGEEGRRLDSAEIYDPKTGLFTMTGHMSAARIYHSAVLLPDGRVAIIGGERGAMGRDSKIYEPNGTKVVEVYDPGTGQFSKLGALIYPRRYSVSVYLNTDEIMVVGSISSDFFENLDDFRKNRNLIELFDSNKGMSIIGKSSLINYSYSINNFAITGLINGNVLFTGGEDVVKEGNSPTTAKSQIFQVDTRAFEAIASMNERRELHTATGLSNGDVLIVGGENKKITRRLKSTEIFHTKDRLFSRYIDLPAGINGHTAILLNNKVCLVNMNIPGSPNIGLIDMTSSTFSYAGSIPPRSDGTVTKLNEDTILITGGNSGVGFLKTSYLYRAPQ